MEIKIPYYEDKSRISNSNIGWFLNKGPKYLHDMLTGKGEDEKGAQLTRGTMIHEYILQPEEFNKDYLVWNKSRPSSAQQEKFCQELASSLEIEPNRAILEAYKASYSTNGKTDDKMLSEGLKIAKNNEEYIDFLKRNDSRQLISMYDVQMLERIKENVQQHKLASKLIREAGAYGSDVIYHEFHINWTCNVGDHMLVSCKSLLDSVEFDFKRKLCILSDLKTTVNLWNFQDSMEHYDYLRQLRYYQMALMWYIKNELNDNPDDWDFRFYIVAIDTTGKNDVRVFEFTLEQVESRSETILSALHDIAWHWTNDKWEHSMSYYLGDGSEKLDI